jgi:hypothetical protein
MYGCVGVSLLLVGVIVPWLVLVLGSLHRSLGGVKDHPLDVGEGGDKLIHAVNFKSVA